MDKMDRKELRAINSDFEEKSEHKRARIKELKKNDPIKEK